jgi:hypothetical protein
MLKAGFGSTTMLLGLSALAPARQNYQSHWPDRLPDKEQGARPQDRRHTSTPQWIPPNEDSRMADAYRVECVMDRSCPLYVRQLAVSHTDRMPAIFSEIAK